VILLKNISIDIETFSDVDLNKCGVYKYAESPNFEILLFGYAVDGSEVQVIDLAQGEAIPQDIIDALTDDTVTKWAFNANFERVCLSRYLSDLDISLETDSLGKKVVAELIKTAPPELQNVLELRQQLAKSSVKKYQPC
jgi:DNA polymerase